MNNVKHSVLVLASLCLIGLSACKGEDAGAVHDADWYLANSKELPTKLAACKADPVAAKADAECAAATNAFLRWYAASGQQAAQASKDAASLDSRLSAPAPDAGAPAGDASMPADAAPVDGAPADPNAPAAQPEQDPSKTSP